MNPKLKIKVPEILLSDIEDDFISLYSPVKNFKSLLLGDSVYIENEYGVVFNYSKIQKLIQIAFIDGNTKTYSLDDESIEILKRDYLKTTEDNGGWLL